MELRSAILQSSSSLPPRFPALKPTADFASPFSLFVANSLPLPSFTFTSKDQQHYFPATAYDTRAMQNCIGEGLSCTGASSGACPCDDPSGSDDYDGTRFLENYQMIIRDCDKLIEAFMMDETDWRRLLVFNKKWSNISPHFFRHCKDRADTEDNPLMKNKLLWLGKKFKEIDEDIRRHNEVIEMIKRNPSEINEIVSRNRKDFTEEFFMHLHTVAEFYDDNPRTQNVLE